MAYTIAAARRRAACSPPWSSRPTPSSTRTIARHYGAEVPFLRPAALAGDLSPDIEWVEHTLAALALRAARSTASASCGRRARSGSAETIQRARGSSFAARAGVDSLRAVEKCTQHPGKMWVVRGGRMLPLLPLGPAEQPWHSSQYQALPEVYVQNASLEIAWTRVVCGDRHDRGRGDHAVPDRRARGLRRQSARTTGRWPRSWSQHRRGSCRRSCSAAVSLHGVVMIEYSTHPAVRIRPRRAQRRRPDADAAGAAGRHVPVQHAVGGEARRLGASRLQLQRDGHRRLAVLPTR